MLLIPKLIMLALVGLKVKHSEQFSECDKGCLSFTGGILVWIKNSVQPRKQIFVLTTKDLLIYNKIDHTLPIKAILITDFVSNELKKHISVGLSD